MKRTRKFYVGATIAAVIVVLAIAQYTLQTVARAQESGGAKAGIYEVDRMWPKPLPNNWVLGSTVGLAIDARDHVFVVHRGQATLDPKFASQMVFAPPAARGGRAGAAPGAPARGDAAIGEDVASGAKPISDLCCTVGSARAGVRSGRQPGEPLGRPGNGFEWPPSMHGITIDAKTTCGSPATAATRC
jgi:hypothetical protein